MSTMEAICAGQVKRARTGVNRSRSSYFDPLIGRRIPMGSSEGKGAIEAPFLLPKVEVTNCDVQSGTEDGVRRQLVLDVDAPRQDDTLLRKLTQTASITIEQRIYLIRGQKVMLDRDFARIYGVETFRLNEAVKRNRRRFPEDFMFQLTAEENRSLTSQFAMSKPAGRGGRRTLPYAFTEHGVAMLSSILNSERAVQMNILIVRAFVRLREILTTHKDLARAIEDIRRRQEEQGEQITAIIETINQLLLPEPVPPKRRIGFNTGDGTESDK